MTTNPFAQFDPNPAPATPTPPANNNPFAQFDPNPAPATPTPPQSEPPKATFVDSLKQGFDSTKAGEMLDLHRAYTKSIPELEQLSKTASNSITKFFYDSELENAKKGLNETQQWLSEYQANQQIAPRSPELEAFNKTNSFSDAATELLKNPLEITKHGLAQSAVPMGLMLGNAYLGGRAGGTSGMVAAGGLTSFDVEYKNGVMDGLQKAGVDIGNSDSLNAALNNKPLMDKIHLQAEQKAVVVGAADAASMGIAGKTLSLKPVKNALAQGVAQAGLGAGGDAVGSLYSGQDVNPPSVMLEGLLEIPGGAAETVIAARHSNKPVAATNTTNNNTDNPFKQFDPKPIPNTGDDNVNIYDEGKTDNQSPNNSGIGALIASGEGEYGSFNRGVAGDARGEKIDFSQMTVGELMQRQALPKGHPSRIFTIGKYQTTPSTFKEAVKSLKIPLDTPVTPELQEQIFSQHLLDKKRPDISGFIRGEHNDVRRAQLAGAQEWASIADPLTGKSYYHGKGNNSASISADKFGAALQSARRTYADAIAQGKTPAEAWSQAIGSGAVTQAWQNTNTNTVGMASPATPDILQAALDTANQTEKSLNNTDPITEQSLEQPLAEIPNYPGQDTRIRTEAGDWHDGQYQVVEADSINSTSSKDSNQYRDRNRFGLTTQVNKIAGNLEYDLVGKSPVMEYGAPVVGKDGTVIAGNGRLAGIQQAYANQKADDYKLKLLADAKNLGIDPSAIQGMKNPVLIRRLKNNADIKQLATLSNEGGAARMSPLEQAKVDAERIGSLHGFTPTESGEISQQSSGELLKRLMAKTPQNQHNSLIDSGGGFMSQEGARRVQNALLYMAYGDSPALSRLVESTDDTSLNVLRGLNKAAPALAEMRDNIKAGISHDANIIPEIVAAVEVFTRLKARGVNVQEWLGQIDAFNNAPPEIKSILSFLNNNTRSPNAISSMLTNYANLLKGYGSPSQQDIFDAKPPTKQEVLNRAIQSTGQSPAKFDQIQPATATNTEHGTGSTGYTGDNEVNHSTTKPEPSKSIKAGNSQVKNTVNAKDLGLDPNADLNTDAQSTDHKVDLKKYTKPFKPTVNAKDLGLDPNADLNTESSGDAGINLASQAKKPVVDNKIKFSPTHELPNGTLVVESEDEKGIWVDEEGIEYESVAYPLPSNTDTKDANNEPNNTRNLESNSEPTRNGNGSIQAPVQATRERNRSGSGGVDKPTNKERDSSVTGNAIPNVSFDHIDGLNDLFDALNEVNFSDRTTEPSPTTSITSTVIPDTKKVVDEPTTTRESTPDTTNDNNDFDGLSIKHSVSTNSLPVVAGNNGELIDKSAVDSDSIIKTLARILRRDPIVIREMPDGRSGAYFKSDESLITTRPYHIVDVNEIIRELGNKLKDRLRAEGKVIPSNPADMSRDEFIIAYELGGVVSDFEVFGHELDTVLDTHTNGTFQVNIDALYDKVQSEKNGKKSMGAITPPNPTTKSIIIASLSARLGQKTVNQLIRHSRLVISSAKPNSNIAASYSNNTVTLYPENIQQGDEWAVFLHEAGEHANLSNMLGQAKYQQVTNQFKKLLDENNPDAMLAAKRVPPNTPKKHIASEQLGYLIENITSNIAQTPKAIFLGKRISSFVRAWAFDKLPQWLTSHIQLTPLDIQALAARAARSWSTSQNSPILRSSEDNLSKTGDSEQTQYSIAKIFNEASKKISPYHKRTFIEGSANAARMLSNELLGSIHQSIRGISTPSAKKIADMIRRPMENEASTEQGALDDMDVATTARHGEFEGRLQKILEPITGRHGLSKADREALVRGLHTGRIPARLAPIATQLRAWLDDLKVYQEASGLDFGYIKNYFPRSYNIESVLNRSSDFIDMLTKNGYSTQVASDILAKIVNGDALPEMPVSSSNRINSIHAHDRILGKEGYSGKSPHQKQRMLDIPYNELAPFLNNDLESMLSRYMRNAIKRSEYARKFGANEEVLNDLVANMVDEIKKGVGVTYGHMTAEQAVKFVYDAADIMQGVFSQPSTAFGGKIQRAILNMQILSKLALASLSAAPEFITPLLISGSPIAYAKGIVEGFAAGAYEALRSTDKLITGKNHLLQSEGYAIAEELGVIAHSEIMEMLESMHAWDSGNKDLLGIAVNKFMSITLQEPITRLQKVIATKTFMASVRRWSKTATQSKNSDQMLMDFGIDPKEAKKWADANYPQNGALAYAINRGAIRFANTAITTPGKANKSRFFQRKSGLYPLINQFQAFSNAFGNTALRRVMVQMKRGKEGHQLIVLAALVAMVGLAFAAQELRDEWKFGKNKPYKNDIDKNPARRVMNAIDRAGLTGVFSRLFELLSPYKHSYNQQGAARIASLAGPAAGDLGKFIDAFLVDQDNPKKQADMQAKFIVNSLPAANAIPYKLKQDKLVDPLARSLK